MTRKQAQAEAERRWSAGEVAVGVVRWRRHRSPRFWVGIVFTDGRPPQEAGTSNVDWESAFAIADGAA